VKQRVHTVSEALDPDETVTQYLPLVKRLARHLAAKLPPSVQFDDLVQAGLIGLVEAIGRYEESQGTQFETYAAQRIRGAMLDELRAHDWLPRGVRRTQKSVEKAIAKAGQRLGRAPQEADVAVELGVALADYQKMLADAHCGQLTYFEDFEDLGRGGGDDESGWFDRHLRSQSATPPEALENERFRAELTAAIGALPEREKLLRSLYYEEELSFREIAAVLGVSESRVCQLHSQAVARLRTRLA